MHVSTTLTSSVWLETNLHSQVLSISDLDTREALHACTRMRANVKNKIEHHDHDQIKEAVSIVGGRLSYLNKVGEFMLHSRNAQSRSRYLCYIGR